MKVLCGYPSRFTFTVIKETPVTVGVFFFFGIKRKNPCDWWGYYITGVLGEPQSS